MTTPYLTPLTADEQRAAGIPDPQVLAMADRVRFAELDTLNHVNNKAYMEWFETARVEYINRHCVAFYDEMERPRTVIRNGNIHYIREMVLGEDYVATAQVTGFRESSVVMDQQLWSGGTLRARMSAVLVTLLPDGSGKYPLPEPLRQAFADRDGAVAG